MQRCEMDLRGGLGRSSSKPVSPAVEAHVRFIEVMSVFVFEKTRGKTEELVKKPKKIKRRNKKKRDCATR
jgi:hypothetical protein